MPKYRQEQVTERIREHLERYIALEQCFEPSDIHTPTTPAQLFAMSSFAEAEDAAKRLRERWQIGEDAIANLTELLEEQGIKVALLNGTDDFDGAFAWRPTPSSGMPPALAAVAVAVRRARGLSRLVLLGFKELPRKTRLA